MKHIIKVNDIQEAKDSTIRPIIAMDTNKHLFFEGVKVIPEGFVDLGLPSGTLWSTSLLGATNGDTAESWYGNYYAWGELEEKSGWDGQGTKVQYSWTTYKYANGAQNKLTKYCNDSTYGNEGFTDDLIQLVPEDDVATQTNPAWRIPTKEDFDELSAGTTDSWVTNYNGISGLKGRVFTSKVNGNTLFIPAAGFRRKSNISDVGLRCHLCSSSLYLSSPNYAYYLYFYSGNVSISTNNSTNRCDGLPICPVC